MALEKLRNILKTNFAPRAVGIEPDEHEALGDMPHVPPELIAHVATRNAAVAAAPAPQRS